MLNKVLLAVLITAIILLIGYICWLKISPIGYIPPKTELPPNAITSVQVSRNRIVIKEQSKPDQTLVIPKSGQVSIVTNKEGVEPQVVVQKASWMPQLTAIPQVGICAGRYIEPCLTLQFLRVEPIQVGLGITVTPSLAGLSVDRDILDNASVGLILGYDKELHQTIGLKISLYL